MDDHAWVEAARGGGVRDEETETGATEESAEGGTPEDASEEVPVTGEPADDARREPTEDAPPQEIPSLDEALAKLNEALKARDRNLASLWTDPAWDSIRSDPRFRQILSDARRGRPSSGRPGRF